MKLQRNAKHEILWRIRRNLTFFAILQIWQILWNLPNLSNSLKLSKILPNSSPVSNWSTFDNFTKFCFDNFTTFWQICRNLIELANVDKFVEIWQTYQILTILSNFVKIWKLCYMLTTLTNYLYVCCQTLSDAYPV